MKLKIKLLGPDGQVPTYGTAGAACFDIYAAEEATAHVGMRTIVRTQTAYEIPSGHVMLVFSRSGHGFKHSVRLSNCVGVIDADYRGELMVAIHNDGVMGFRVQKGDRIAQAMIVPIPSVTFEVGELSETARGEGGMGSTGQ